MDANREHRRLARDLVEEVLKTALAVQEIMGALLEDIPEGALPGGDNASALLEMMIGTVVPAARGAGEVDCRKATALVASIRDRILDDLAAAAARGHEPGQ
jgi:hypothetical protein